MVDGRGEMKKMEAINEDAAEGQDGSGRITQERQQQRKG